MSVMSGTRVAVLIAGPTASGKSALALAMAAERNAVIINADAMQVYDTLSVVTARPSDDDLQRAEHRLYGFAPAAQRFSTGRWLAEAQSAFSQTGGRTLIFVGGTGLYFDALLHGFAEIPPVPDAVALEVQQEIQALDAGERLALLQREDPETAARLKVADPQRVIRALAVKRATGQTLSSFQNAPQTGMLDGWNVERLVLDPDRDVLRERISRRFEAMFAGGAVAEVEAVLGQQIEPSLPAMKAIGVPEIAGWLAGRWSREEALQLAITATHQYAKRQRTWFRNRMGDWPRR